MGHRLHAIVKLIEVRHNVGVEEESTLDQWKALEVDRVFDRDTDKRKRDPVLKELAKRGDGDWLSQSILEISQFNKAETL